MATILIARVKQRLAEVDSALKALEAERDDLLATIRTAERLTGSGLADIDKPTGTDAVKVAPLTQGQAAARLTFPALVFSILKDGPLQRDRLIEEILKRNANVASTVLSSSLARMTLQEKIIKDDNGIYRLPDSSSTNQ